jgi:anthranilate synthase component 1
VDDPLAKLEEILSGFSAAQLPELPRFVGGAVGYAGYDAVRYYESLPNAPKDDRSLPDIHFGLYDGMVIFDHVQKLIKVVAHAHVERDGVEGSYENARRRIEAVVQALSEVKPAALLAMSAAEVDLPFESTFARPEFENAVKQCKDYIRAGDIFQVVISQRLEVQTRADPFDIYRALRAVNPSPFMFYLKTPETTLVGASPEVLCRVEHGLVTTRPLAGTRPRGKTDSEDRAMERELLADPKERAEHVMLVDLGRNDVGRVSRIGTVKVDELMTIERYAHVMHICSNVTGELAEGKTSFDALRAVLPVGTVSGAPKIRAMEIIDELEPTRRGPYGGAVGYVDFAGNMDTCIALRTLVITQGGDGGRRVYVQVGAGVVADSDPSSEYEETMHKAASMLRAINVAEQWGVTKKQIRG